MFAIAWGANQFVSLVIAYRLHAGVSVTTSEVLVGIYAVGLIPALLIGGPIADRYGRAGVLRTGLLLSMAATLVLMAGAHSTAPLYAGRFLAGVASGAAFAAGTAWVKELSGAPWDQGSAPGTGARRAAVALSMGFGLGPVAAGVIAQWAPDPLVTPYLAHLVVAAAVLPGLWRSPETVAPSAGAGLLARMRVPAAGHRRFLGVVLPLAPWVFAAPTVSFAVLPGLVSSHTGHLQIAFAALVAGLTLAAGVLVQPLARRLDAPPIGLAVVGAGLALAAGAAHLANPEAVTVAAIVLGAGYGFCLVSGLLEVQRLAGPDDLAGLTAVYYALTYVGFGVPVLLAELSHRFSYPSQLLTLTLLAALALAVVATRSPEGS
jgi:MFS family permease